ncbi:hypothetical protein [Actinomadura sp. DC4]|uniref:hypothetical protein n=1 Tax=Actinomadura sp. DC4 TaxID=3055069 RepID=UPI0025B24B2F|nr:hypothetical protein [Actinomadura sp. DC4]MDN3352777.1 hypothetical protein [Actinomadura sp. DC4]
MKPDDAPQTFVHDVELVVGSTGDEHEITKRVAERLSALLSGDYRLPPEVPRPSDERHVNHPLHIAADDGWSLACAVWNVGQRTPVHGHGTWDMGRVRWFVSGWNAPAADGSSMAREEPATARTGPDSDLLSRCADQDL